MQGIDLKKVARVIVKSLLVASVLFIFIFAVDATFVLKFPKRALPKEKVDAVVVLGAAINSQAAYKRTMKALRLYEDGFGKQLVLAGGRTSNLDETEAHYMGRIVTTNAIESPHFLLEEQSQNTWENLENTKKLLPENASILIISDTYHLPRAVLIARKLGFRQVYWDSPDQYYYPDRDLRWYYFREMAAILDYLPRLVF